jgi:hypothetical protein
LNDDFQNKEIDTISYKAWVSTDRSTLLNIDENVNDFAVQFVNHFTKLLPHSFTSKNQSLFLNELNNELVFDEYIIIGDFSENYSFVIQTTNYTQSFHWNNPQATIHPFVVYFKNKITNLLDHISYVIISENLQHSTVAVYLYQQRLLSFLTQKFGKPNKIHYFSGGSTAQYKNNFFFNNLLHHDEDFNIKAEWHFFASSHGKNAYDGIGGCVKRLAARASLQKTVDGQITTPKQLFDWVNENIKRITFCFITNIEYNENEHLLQNRFAICKAIRKHNHFTQMFL